jgi:tetratricopeptide (TPR) repeat protein
MAVRSSSSGQRLPLFVRSLAAALKGSFTEERALAEVKTQGDLQRAIGELEVAAVAASVRKDHDQAIELMKKAIALEEQLGPPSGPPGLIKPSHELFGEILLRAGKPEAAAEQFKTALLRQPNRARSLLGAARAAAQSGDRGGATAAYSKLLDQWQQADKELAELREAQDYLKQAR